MRKDFSPHFDRHPLRREIIATALVNYVVNNGGSAVLSKLTAQGNATVERAVEAYLAADRELRAPESRRGALASGLAAEAEHAALLEIENAVEQSALRR